VRAGDVAGAIEDFERSLDALAPDDATARAEVEDWLKRLR
jgi:hypothetical protein